MYIYIYTYIYIYNGLLAIEKNDIMSFAETWMELEVIIVSEVSQRQKNILYYHLHVDSKIQTNLFAKQNRLTDIENRVTRGDGGEG